MISRLPRLVTRRALTELQAVRDADAELLLIFCRTSGAHTRHPRRAEAASSRWPDWSCRRSLSVEALWRREGVRGVHGRLVVGHGAPRWRSRVRPRRGLSRELRARSGGATSGLGRPASGGGESASGSWCRRRHGGGASGGESRVRCPGASRRGPAGPEPIHFVRFRRFDRRLRGGAAPQPLVARRF